MSPVSAILFLGQGNQTPDMRDIVAQTQPTLLAMAVDAVDALTHPVRWRETMLALHERGAERFVEVGPGRILAGLAKRTLRDVELVNA